MQRAQSLFVKATLSPVPQVKRAANENLSAMLHHSPPGGSRDDTTAAMVGAALVAVALLAIFTGSVESSGGSGSGSGTSTSTVSGPFGGASSQDEHATAPAQAHGREHLRDSHGQRGKESGRRREIALADSFRRNSGRL